MLSNLMSMISSYYMYYDQNVQISIIVVVISIYSRSRYSFFDIMKSNYLLTLFIIMIVDI